MVAKGALQPPHSLYLSLMCAFALAAALSVFRSTRLNSICLCVCCTRCVIRDDFNAKQWWLSRFIFCFFFLSSYLRLHSMNDEECARVKSAHSLFLPFSILSVHWIKLCSASGAELFEFTCHLIHFLMGRMGTKWNLHQWQQKNPPNEMLLLLWMKWESSRRYSPFKQP